MAKVLLSEYSSDPIFQEAWEHVYEYEYCDECGSFDIRYYSKLPGSIENLLTILFLVCIPIILVILVFFTSYWTISCLIGLICLIDFFILGAMGFKACNRCGNKKFTDKNTLGYSTGNHKWINASDEIQRRHIKTMYKE